MTFDVIIDSVNRSVTFADGRTIQFIVLDTPPHDHDRERLQRENRAMGQASIQTDEEDSPEAKRDGRAFTPPSDSSLVKSSIAKEKNQRAAGIVRAVVALIEQADSNVPQIGAQAIVDQVPDLKCALEAAVAAKSKNITAKKDRLLRRAFAKAWKLLETQTELKAVYKNIQFPKEVPTSSRLGTTIFEFPHDGKIGLMD